MEKNEATTITYDYLVVINPDAHIARDVTHYKYMIAHELGEPRQSFSPAYIPLFRSEFPGCYEEDFIGVLAYLAQLQSAFTIYTSRIDHSEVGEQKHTIFVNVANPRPVEALHSRIMNAFEVDAQHYRPQITLARGLSSPAFEKVLKQIDNKLFVRSFYCHSFLLLRKPAMGGDYEVVREFSFGMDDPHDGPLFHRAA
ncbi:2'-5' RNA ligase [Chitinophaga skermanii]|uniref:2'-5' RNA ligase n=1 Tax=Chitinophaga skermanii TaxID=331697 RepID=A0A327QGK4_9BACT|nr:2'-5' RNA ligase family protein [Chitinophaga skermanii]RAJ02453.1 2'-5' RNA ligase [Chitinophaga skermanii]